MTALKTVGKRRAKHEYGRIGVFMGGDSHERDISLISGAAILEAMQAQGLDAVAVDVRYDTLFSILSTQRFDTVFLALHGPNGEDGRIQAVLDLMKIPYTGSGFEASALAMNKWLSKQLWLNAGLPALPGCVLTDDFDPQKIVDDYGIPLAVKAAHEGSTIGVYRVDSLKDLVAAYDKAKQYDPVVMIEPWVRGEEFTVGIVGNDVLPSINIKPAASYYDFHAKYQANDTQYILPSGLSDHEEAHLLDIAKQAYDCLGCEGWGRVDFMRDAEGKFWLLEVNTTPGLTDHSLVPKAVKYLGYTFVDLMYAILESSMTRKMKWADCA